MRAHEFILETQLEEGKWNEEILKNLLRAAFAALVAYGGFEAKRLTTDLDKPALDKMVQQLQVAGPDRVAKIVKKAKQTKSIDATDKLYLDQLISRSAN